MGKYFDIPVSVYADDSKISIAILTKSKLIIKKGKEARVEYL